MQTISYVVSEILLGWTEGPGGCSLKVNGGKGSEGGGFEGACIDLYWYRQVDTTRQVEFPTSHMTT